ncbi:MAG: ROK family transcriptional regulator [Angelakisella sp.]
MIKAGKETIKCINKQNILNSFCGSSNVSKSDIISATGLSAATVSSLIQELVDENFVTEHCYGKSSGGRKPMLYNLNRSLAFILTVRITPKGILAGVINLNAELVYYKAFPSRIYSTQSLRDALDQSVADLRSSEPELFAKISVVAYSIPGVVDYSTRVVVYSAALYLEDCDLQQFTAAALGRSLEVYVFKDTDALVLGEYYSNMQDQRNMAYILCESGVGMSIINRGKLLRIDNCGLELGHTTIDLHGEICKCSSVGCVGTLLGELAAVHRYAKLYEQQKNDFLLDITTISYDDIVTMHLEHSDGIATQVLAEQLEIMAVSITNVVNLFNPDVVIVGGPMARLPELEEKLTEQVRAHALKPFTRNLVICSSKQNANSSLSGMANYVLRKQFFKPVSL